MLKRNICLARRQTLRRRAPLRRCSLRRAALVRATRAARRPFLQEFPTCAYPGCQRRAICIHEIAFGRGIRQRAYAERCTWLPACHDHNRSGCGFHDPCKMPIARQCALKWMLDSAHYDLDRINELRGRSAEAITDAEVQAFVAKIDGILYPASCQSASGPEEQK